MPTDNNSNRSNNRTNKTQIDTNYAHLQPQAVELEKVVLGALMVDADAFSVVSEVLKPDTFYDPRHQKIYEAIQTMNMEERPVDVMTSPMSWPRWANYRRWAEPAYLMEISSQVASAAHIESHARILAQRYLQRQLIHFAGGIETQAYRHERGCG